MSPPVSPHIFPSCACVRSPRVMDTSPVRLGTLVPSCCPSASVRPSRQWPQAAQGQGCDGSVGHNSTHDRYAFPPSRPQGQVPLLPREPSSAETGRRPRAPAAGRGPRGPPGHWSQVSPSAPAWAPTHLLPLSLPGPLPEETPPWAARPPTPCGLADTPCGAVVQSLGNSTYGHLHGLQRAFLFSPLPEP